MSREILVGIQRALTPGGALKKGPKSTAKSKSVNRLCAKECKDTFTLDSLALVPLTAFDVRCSSSNDRGLDLCNKVRYGVVHDICVDLPNPYIRLAIAVT